MDDIYEDECVFSLKSPVTSQLMPRRNVCGRIWVLPKSSQTLPQMSRERERETCFYMI